MSPVKENLLNRAIVALAVLSLLATLFLGIRFFVAGSTRFGFLVWNLFLAWIPLAISMWFVPTGRSSNPLRVVFVFAIWLAFLPNTFYIISDLVHLVPSGQINILFDVALLFCFGLIGFILGLISLGVVHGWLRRRLTKNSALGVVNIIILLCSFAIYLGRYLRWNSWDIAINPVGLLVDITDRVISPLSSPKTATTTIIFFVLISSFYFIAHWFVAGIDNKSTPRRSKKYN